MLKAADLNGVPDDLALEVIAQAVTVAPCLDKLPDADAEGDLAEYRKRALAVLRRVAGYAHRRGDTLVRSQRVGSAGVDYGMVGTAFSPDAISALQGICRMLCASPVGNGPVGSFPKPGVVHGVWPELRED